MTFLAASILLGQAGDQKPVHPKHTTTVVSESPVTAREAHDSFVRAIGLLQKNHTPALGAPSIPATNRPATREEIVAEMARLAKAAEPAYRFTPMPTAYDAKVLKIGVSQRPALLALIQRGFVARIGPLAVGPGLGLTPKKFGDALGFFMARVAQVAHLPSPKWTPMLQGD